MNAPISTVESDSQWVLTNYARSATCIMATEVLVLSLSHLPCLHMTSFNNISFIFPAWILTLSLSRSENLSSHIYLVKGTWSYVKMVFWKLTITTVPCHTVMFTGLSRSLHGAKSFTDQDIVVFCPCYYYTLEDLGHCPILGRGQEVRVAVFSALHSDWTARLCQRRFPQFNAPCRNKTHSVGLYVYSSNVEAKLIMRADYRLYIVRVTAFTQQ